MWATYPISNPNKRDGKMGIVLARIKRPTTSKGNNNVWVIPRCLRCFDNHGCLEPIFDCDMSISGNKLPGNAASIPIAGYMTAPAIFSVGQAIVAVTAAETPHITCTLPVMTSLLPYYR